MVSHCDPTYVGVVYDPGHLAIDGEPLEMALEALGEHFCFVHVKCPDWKRVGVTAERSARWERDFNAGIRDGLVDWPATLKLLAAKGYDGPLSFYGYYTDNAEEDRRRNGADVAFLKRHLP